jgi:hypothetical protein
MRAGKALTKEFAQANVQTYRHDDRLNKVCSCGYYYAMLVISHDKRFERDSDKNERNKETGTD